MWDQYSLVNSFSTMALTPSIVTDGVADSVASNYTTSDAGNLTCVHLPTSTDPSSIFRATLTTKDGSVRWLDVAAGGGGAARSTLTRRAEATASHGPTTVR
jgi:hypothetical protein